MRANPVSPRAIVEAEGLTQLSDAGALEAACRAAVDANPKQVAQYKGGNEKIIGFFVVLTCADTLHKQGTSTTDAGDAASAPSCLFAFNHALLRAAVRFSATSGLCLQGDSRGVTSESHRCAGVPPPARSLRR